MQRADEIGALKRLTVHLAARSLRPRLFIVGVAILLSAWIGASVPVAAAAPTVQWRKDPPLISATLTDPAQTFVFSEVMLNQSDPAGFGGFTFTVTYDSTIWQVPEIDTTPAITLFVAAGRNLSCWPAGSSSNYIQMVCASTGTIGNGPVWTGPQVLATVTLTLLPAVAQKILTNASGGVSTTVHDTAVQVTNTCGQPLNDATIQPVPGQPECQGVVLAGLSSSGVVLSAGATTVTIKPPSTTTATATLPPTQTFTPQPSSTRQTTPVPTITRTPRSTQTAAPSTTKSPSTSTAVATSTAPHTTTATAAPTHAASTGTAQPSSTAGAVRTTPTAAPCSHDYPYWRDHPGDWAVESLQLGSTAYRKADLVQILSNALQTDASVVLARELIAAKLNLAQGAPSQNIDAVIQADGLLAGAGARLPFALDASLKTDYRAQGMIWAAALLARANEDCRGAVASDATGPTPVSSVLGSTNQGNGAKSLPDTGSPLRMLGDSSTATVITGLCVIIVVLVLALVRLTFLDEQQ